jgi:hypothetical protein
MPAELFKYRCRSGGGKEKAMYRIRHDVANNRMRLGFVGKLCQWDVVDCDNFTAAISCLRSFLALDKKPVFVLPDDGSPSEVYKRDTDAPWMALDFESAAKKAEELLNWEGRIIHWEDGAKLGVSVRGMISYIPA